MTQSKKPSKSKSSKKSTTASTSKKVKRTASEKRVEIVVAPAVLETVTQVAEPVMAPVVEEAAPVRTLSRAEFMELVRKEAYSRAARRNFKNGSPFQDWVNAEAAVSGKLAAEGVRLS